MKDNFYKEIIEYSPIGYANHRIICDDKGIPIDYEFLEVNGAFEKLTGLDGAKVVGSRMSELFPNSNNMFDWIKTYGEIAINREEKEFKQFSEPLNRWYRIKTYSPEKYFFITLFIDITKEVEDLDKFKNKTEELEGFFSINLDLLCIADLNGNFIKVNKSWEEILGYPTNELEKRKIYEFVHPEDMEDTLEAMARLGKQEKVLNFANRYRRKDGSYRYIEWRAQPNGRLIYSAARDITERVMVEKQLQEQKEQFEIAIRGSNDGIWDWNVLTDTLFLSAKWKEQLGFNEDELPNEFKTFESRLHLEDKERVLEKIRQYLKGLIHKYDMEFRMLHKDGNYRWIQARGEALRDKNGNPYRMAGSHTDITERKTTEANILSSHNQMLAILDNINTLIYVADMQTYEIIFINKAGKNIWGDLKGKKCWQIINSNQTGPCSFCINDQLLDESGKILEIYRWEYFNSIIKKWYNRSDQTIIWSDGRIVRLQVAYDISETKQANEKILMYTKELEHKNRQIEAVYNILNKEVNKAFYLHKQFLPESFSYIKWLSISSYYQPAQYLGGDIYDVRQLNNRVLFYIADVSGHGIDGAMLGIFARENITNFIFSNNEILDSVEPHIIIEHLKDRFYQENFSEEYFICILIGIIDPISESISFSNAGIQISPIILDAKGKAKTIKTEGLPISKSIEIEAYEYSTFTEEYKSGDTIFITTDGLIEEHRNDVTYSTCRLKEALSLNYSLPPDILKEIINEDFYNFTGKYQGQDDITYLIIKAENEVYSKSFIIDSTRETPNEALEILRQSIGNFLEENEMFMIGLYEVIANAVEHGNKLELVKKVNINIRITEKYIIVSVKDQGEGFNWRDFLDKEYDPLSLNERGRGIGLSKMYSDYLYYNPKGNLVKLVKFL